jgi:maltooligosyltrehalose trehalohydrolase
MSAATTAPTHRPVGARIAAGGVQFRVWAPGHASVEVVLYGPDAERVVAMAAEGAGYFAATVEGAGPGTRYRYRLDGGDAFPDPASSAQPDGVHGPSEVVDPAAFAWTDDGWKGVPLEEMVVYEVHVGTATPEGTFDALIGRLDHVAALGANAIEIMPVASFPGRWNWGYDGVGLFAPAAPYGGPEGLRRLVDAAHARGIAVILDVVYNHFGPEGNYLPAFTGGRVFTERHHTPWGAAINYDGPESGPVRGFVLQNAVAWARDFHVDGLRLDATHAIIDDSPRHVLTELAATLRAALPPDRAFVLFAEDERNERRLVTPAAEGGIGLDAVWADDFHHQVRRLAAGDHEGYFADFGGTAEEVAGTWEAGWWYRGLVAPGHGGPRGTPPEGLPPAAFVHCIQNHDQVGNRAMGDRLSDAVPAPVYRAASALLLLSPYTPLLWMGQEWAATTPFLYFTDHPEELGRLVTEGRRREFGRFSAFADPATRERIPDPQAESTFVRSKLDWSEPERGHHAGILALHRELLRLRATHPALRRRDRAFRVSAPAPGVVALRRTGAEGEEVLLVAALAGEGGEIDLAREAATAPPPGGWSLRLSTEEGRFGGEAEGAAATLSPEGRLRLGGAGAVVLEGRLQGG